MAKMKSLSDFPPLSDMAWKDDGTKKEEQEGDYIELEELLRQINEKKKGGIKKVV